MPSAARAGMGRAATAAITQSTTAAGNHNSTGQRGRPVAAGSIGPTLYQMLQLDPSADPEVIDAAYKRLAFKYHPDRDKSPESVNRMQAINEAKRILSDPDLRDRYDRSIGIVRKPPPPKRGVAIRADEV